MKVLVQLRLEVADEILAGQTHPLFRLKIQGQPAFCSNEHLFEILGHADRGWEIVDFLKIDLIDDFAGCGVKHLENRVLGKGNDVLALRRKYRGKERGLEAFEIPEVLTRLMIPKRQLLAVL